MPDRILYCLNLNSFICFRAGSKSPVTFKIKLSVTTVNSSSQLLPFCHKELHLRCCIEVELNIVTWSIKILKTHFQRFITLSFLHLISNGLKGVNHWCRLWKCCKLVCGIFIKATHPFHFIGHFIGPNVIKKLANNWYILVKLMEVWCSFENSRIRLFKLFGLIVNNRETVNTRKRNTLNNSVLKVFKCLSNFHII